MFVVFGVCAGEGKFTVVASVLRREPHKLGHELGQKLHPPLSVQKGSAAAAPALSGRVSGAPCTREKEDVELWNSEQALEGGMAPGRHRTSLDKQGPGSRWGLVHPGLGPQLSWRRVLHRGLLALQEPRGSFPEMIVQFVDECGEAVTWTSCS